jgi:hypothetical protein
LLREDIPSLIREVKNRVTETFDDRGELARVLKRGELGEEVDSLDDKLSFWGTRFRVNLSMLYTNLGTLTIFVSEQSFGGYPD